MKIFFVWASAVGKLNFTAGSTLQAVSDKNSVSDSVSFQAKYSVPKCSGLLIVVECQDERWL